MKYELTLDHKQKMPKHKQIVCAISRDIECGALKKDFHLPSINELSSSYAISRDTIDKAYRELKGEGYITSVPGKGFFVVGKKDTRLRILLVFNDFSSHKKILYDSFIKTVGKQAKVDVQIHHYDPKILGEIIEANAGRYHYYIIMPHFYHNVQPREYRAKFNSIPSNQLILLDKNLPKLNATPPGVFQDFSGDIYEGLTKMNSQLQKYNHIKIVYPRLSHYPLEIMEGVSQYCTTTGKQFSVIDTLADEQLQTGVLYVILREDEVGQMIKQVRKSQFILGREVGIISFNESILKELLDITVITTDFIEMGISAGNLVLGNIKEQVSNPFRIFIRSSV
jgi:DNA-binding transcriptional regulator YhcF (GntR family)